MTQGGRNDKIGHPAEREVRMSLDSNVAKHLPAFIVGAVMLIADILFQVLDHFSYLDFVKNNHPSLYAFMVSPASFWAISIVGILLLLAVWRELLQHRREAQEQPPPAQEEQSKSSGATASVRDSGNATITQNFYPNIPPVDLPKPKIEPPKPREPRFNFCTSHVFVMFLQEEKDGYSVIEQPQYRGAFTNPQPALVLEITNRTHKDFKPDYASEVVAELLIDGDTNVGPLLWLGHRGGEVAFSWGHPNTLIVSVANSQHSNHWTIPRYLTRITQSGYRSVNTDYSIPDGQEPEVSIVLSIKGKTVREIPLSWKWSNGKPDVDVKPQENQQ